MTTATPLTDAALAPTFNRRVVIDSMTMDGQGVARCASGKVVFVEGALPGEHVDIAVYKHKKQWERAHLQAVARESSLRVRERCPHAGLHKGACGGCQLQHVEPSAQVALKARALEDQLWHLAKVRPQTVLRPIQGASWGYRYRARLSVRYVPRKATVLIGFHERNSRYIADMQTCAVLPPKVSALLLPLRALVMAMQAREQCPQIELACGDHGMALVLRHLVPLGAQDQDLLLQFARDHASLGLQWWLQPGGPLTVQPLCASGVPPLRLSYGLPAFSVALAFKPTDFTQVNPAINRALVARALQHLQVAASESVIDWFCGLGNFTLPLATLARQVIGIEGSSALVERAQSTRAHARGLRCVPQFLARDLFQVHAAQLLDDAAAFGPAEKWLLDPPREGAFALVKALAEVCTQQPQASHWVAPKRLVYVSCNPATLARDTGVLVHLAGYRLRAAGVINMFPHTAHVESMAVFDYAPDEPLDGVRATPLHVAASDTRCIPLHSTQVARQDLQPIEKTHYERSNSDE